MNSQVGAGEPDEAFEELLSTCLAAHAEGGGQALDRALAEHPVHASRIRQRIDELDRFGLLGSFVPEELPARIGPHRILSRLGRGGRGEVFLAEEASDGTRIAIKLAREPWTPDSGTGERLRERFAREVRAVARLSHPDIVGIRESGEHEGRPWFSMDHVAGSTLAAVLARLKAQAIGPGSLTAADVQAVFTLERGAEEDEVAIEGNTYIEWVCRVVARIARAVEHAHAQGIIHRDIKPSNVLMRPDGRALLFDLGLAHLTDDPGLTRSGDLAGTPSYVAPEQADSHVGSVDARTDVWGLGVMLYELLTLRRPFEGDNAARILRAISEEEPIAPRDLVPELPADLEAIVLQALEKDPGRRYGSAAMLAEDLDRILAFRPVLARPAGWSRRLVRKVRRRPAQAAALFLGALVLLGTPVGLFWANTKIRDEARKTEAAATEAIAQAEARGRVVDHLVELFGPDRASVPPDILDDVVTRLLGMSEDSPLVRASLFEAIGRVHHNLGQDEQALRVLDRAFALRQSELAEGGQTPLEVVLTLSEVHLALGNAETAAALVERALDADAPLGNTGRAGVLDLRLACARANRVAGRIEDATRHLSAARKLAEGPDHGPADRSQVALEAARTAVAAGDLDGASVLYLRAISEHATVWDPDPYALAALCLERAEVLERAGEVGEAEGERTRSEQLRAAAERAPGPPPPRSGLEPEWLAGYEELFRKGISALQSADVESAIAHFTRCLELRPYSGVCAYNLACSHAMVGSVDQALSWLKESIEWGFTDSPPGRAALRNDIDLAPLREDSRYGSILELADDRDRSRTRSLNNPLVALPSDEGAGWLITLHDNDSSAEKILDGPWGSLARSAGLGLIAPRAPRVVSPEGTTSARWFEHIAFLGREPWRVEADLEPVLRNISRRHMGRERAWMTGEGAGAAIALELVLHTPGLWRGALLVGTPSLLPEHERLLRIAGSLGVRIRFLVDPASPVADGSSAAEHVSALREWLERVDLAGTVELVLMPSDVQEDQDGRELSRQLEALTPR